MVFQLIKIGYVGAIKSLIDNALDKSRIINSYVVHADDTQGNFTASKRCLGKESHTILCHMALDYSGKRRVFPRKDSGQIGHLSHCLVLFFCCFSTLRYIFVY